MKGYVEAQVLKTFLKAVEPLVNEARLRISPDGISVRAIDPSHVAMVTVSIPKYNFEVFENDEETVVGINVNRLSNVLRHVKKKEVVEVDVNDARVSLKIGSLKYSVPTIPPESIRKEPSEVKMNLTTSVTLNGKKLKEYIDLVSKISDQVTFSSDGDQFYIRGEGDIERIEVSISESDYDLFEFECESPAKSTFSVEYVKELLKIVNDANDLVTIQIGKNMPLHLKLDLVNGRVSVEYILAPRIDYELEEEFEGGGEEKESEESKEGKEEEVEEGDEEGEAEKGENQETSV